MLKPTLNKLIVKDRVDKVLDILQDVTYNLLFPLCEPVLLNNSRNKRLHIQQFNYPDVITAPQKDIQC